MSMVKVGSIGYSALDLLKNVCVRVCGFVVVCV